MLLTRDQQFFLSILRETGYMRRDQVLPLLRLHDPAKEERHCEAILRHLRYAGELVPLGGELVCLPEYREAKPDRDMLWALDILLALASGPPLQITGRKPPYKLSSGPGGWAARSLCGHARGAGPGADHLCAAVPADVGCDAPAGALPPGAAPSAEGEPEALLCGAAGWPPPVL